MDGSACLCREFAQMAFSHAGMPLRWEGKAGTLSETGVVAEGELRGRTVLRINPKYFRPAEVRATALPAGGAERFVLQHQPSSQACMTQIRGMCMHPQSAQSCK